MAKTTPNRIDPDDDSDAPPVAEVSMPPGRPTILSRYWQRYRQGLAAFFQNRQFRPLATAFALTGVIILLGLGTWQVLRLYEKNALLREAKLALQSAPADYTKKAPRDKAEWLGLHYRPVKLRGNWLPLHRIKLAPRTYEEQVGYHLVMPFRLHDNQIVMINRGFMANNNAFLPSATSEVTIFGVARVPEAEKPRYMPENIPSRGQWVWSDLAAMSHDIGVERIAPVIIYEDRVTDHDSFPIGGQLPLPDHNRHRQYAITWFAMALALIGVWLMASGAKPKHDGDTDKAPLKEIDRLDDPVARRGLYPEATD